MAVEETRVNETIVGVPEKDHSNTEETAQTVESADVAEATTEAKTTEAETRAKWKEACARRILNEREAAQAKMNRDDAILINAFNIGRQNAIAAKKAEAALQTAKAAADEASFWEEMQRVYGEPGETKPEKKRLKLPEQKTAQPHKKKRSSAYHAELGSCASWVTAGILLVALVCRIFGMI